MGRITRLPVRGSPATGRYHQKSTVSGRLREKSTVGGRSREKSSRLGEKKGKKKKRKRKKRREEENLKPVLAHAPSLPSPAVRRCAVARARRRPHPHEETERLPAQGERSRRHRLGGVAPFLL
ncbi:hypothetical protein BHE74_00053645, partial [Ensete ventricosum]